MADDDPWPEDGARREGLFGKLRSIFTDNPRGDDLAADFDAAGTRAGDAISESRRAMIERVVAFDSKTVVDVMAPRADIYGVDIETPLKELISAFAQAGHSRMPVYRGDLDDPVGMVHIKDVVGLISAGGADGKESVLPEIRRELLYAPPSMRVTDLLLRMQASRIHMALVIDEYGGTDGLATIEDLVEEIVGEINDEHDEEDEPSVTAAADGGWDVDARVELDVFADETGYRPETEDEEIDTIGGYVVSLAGRLPQRGEIIAGPEGFDFEITEADARKVRKLRVRPAAGGRNEAAE